MAQSDSNRVKIYASKETTWGETPSGPAVKELRITGESLTHEKQVIASNEIRSDRMRADHTEVGRGATGDISGELTFATFSTLFEGALMNTWTASTVAATSATYAASVITLGGAATHSAAALASGTWIRVSAATGTNGGLYKVAAAAASTITITGATLSVVAGVSTNVNWNYLRNGTTETSLLIEKSFNDITEFVWFNGMEVNQMSLQAQAQQISTLVFSFVGKAGNSASTVTIGSAITSANTNTPMNGTGNVSAITEGGSTVAAAIRSLSMTVNNNLRSQQAIGNANPIGVGLGTCEVTGSIEVYFEDGALYDKFRSHTSSSLSFRLTDASNQSIVFTVPSLYFMTGTPAAGALDTDVFLTLNFAAFKDANHSAVIQIDSV